jgi:hypothetical protein
MAGLPSWLDRIDVIVCHQHTLLGIDIEIALVLLHSPQKALQLFLYRCQLSSSSDSYHTPSIGTYQMLYVPNILVQAAHMTRPSRSKDCHKAEDWLAG